MEDIGDADYAHAKKVCKDFEIKHLGEYHDFYVQKNTLLLADVFKNFRNVCFEIFELDPVKNYLSFWISMASSFKKDQFKIRSFNLYRFVINGRKKYKKRNMSLYF